MVTGKDKEKYMFNSFLKMLLLIVASQQKKFFFNMKFISETWFFLMALVMILIATHVQVIMEDRMNKKTEYDKIPE